MPQTKTRTVIDQALALMREGKVQEADDLLAAARSELEQPPAPEPPPAPRAPIVILLDFGRELVAHLGSPPALVRLLREFEAAEGRTAAPAEEK
jgi:hypothetical protein